MNIKYNSQSLAPPPMATIAFYILLTLTLSSTIHARDSQFFNKFSNNIPKQQQQPPLNTNQQPQPEFIPQSQDSDSYGLYGHESGQLPPSATTPTTTTTNTPTNTNNNNYNNNNNNNNNLPDYLPENYNPVAYTTPIHSSTQDIPEEFKEYPQANRYNGESTMYNSEKQEQFMGTNGGNMYNSEKQENGRYYYAGDNGRYKSQKQGFEDARFMDTEDGGNMYNSEKQGENERYNSQTRYSTSGNGNMYNSEKQGMSDTRFQENGKYFYDVNMENLNHNANMNTRGFGSRNEYNTQGYYGNNQNSYDRYNSNGGYQNQGYRFNP